MGRDRGIIKSSIRSHGIKYSIARKSIITMCYFPFFKAIRTTKHTRQYPSRRNGYKHIMRQDGAAFHGT